ncbi:MAG: hypothetical protein HY866_01175 [Chloroflexi bacterium]|nr:hypothetical protein [Chloroflexota bacterium]
MRIIARVLGLIFLPVILLSGWVGRRLGRLLQPLAARVDSSGDLSVWINSISSSMATQRGLLLMIGTVLLVISLLAHGLTLVLLVATDTFGRSLYWLCIPFALLHVGVLTGFTGAMLAIPLGQGYKDK